MSSVACLGWRIPSAEYRRFNRFVWTERGDIDRYLWVFIENAMREYMDTDRLQEVEDALDNALKAGGYTPAELTREKKSNDPLRGKDTVLVNRRVDSDLQEDFMAFVKEHTDFGTRYGLALGYALREYRMNDRTQRIIEKYDRAADDITKLLSEFGDSSGDLSTVEKRTIDFCAQMREKKLTKTVGKRDLREDIIGKRYTSEKTIDQYEERITDRLDLVEHPDNPALYMYEEHAKQLRQETAEAEASEEMDTLMNAAYATDGGEDI